MKAVPHWSQSSRHADPFWWIHRKIVSTQLLKKMSDQFCFEFCSENLKPKMSYRFCLVIWTKKLIKEHFCLVIWIKNINNESYVNNFKNKIPDIYAYLGFFCLVAQNIDNSLSDQPVTTCKQTHPLSHLRFLLRELPLESEGLQNSPSPLLDLLWACLALLSLFFGKGGSTVKSPACVRVSWVAVIALNQRLTVYARIQASVTHLWDRGHVQGTPRKTWRWKRNEKFKKKLTK